MALAEVRPTLEDGAVVVNVGVTEGDQYRLAGFSWLGNTLISSDDLSKIITLKPGEPVNATKLDSDLAQARKLFRKFGHESAQIMAKPAFAENNVTYTFEVREGDLYRMGKLEIEGLDAENTRQLIQAWKLAPGSPYDATYLQQFLTHAVVRIPGRRWEWVIAERLDEPQKTVNVHLQLKIE
jgi:outer membrane protein assembly factor BamA